MAFNQALLRTIPKTDELLGTEALRLLEREIPHKVIMEQVRAVLDEVRQELLRGERETVPTAEELAREAARRVQGAVRKSLRRVINATGVVLHTNLGRAKLCVQAVKAVEWWPTASG